MVNFFQILFMSRDDCLDDGTLEDTRVGCLPRHTGYYLVQGRKNWLLLE